MKIVIITVMIYSALLTTIQLYKDASSYSMGPDTLDLIFAGPVCWLFMGVCAILRHFYKPTQRPAVDPKSYSRSKAERIIKKIVKARKKFNAKCKYLDTIELSTHNYHSEYDQIDGLDKIAVREARYEWVNKKYSRMLYYQFDLVVELLTPYLGKWTEEMYRKANFDDYWIEKYKNTDLYYIK